MAFGRFLLTLGVSSGLSLILIAALPALKLARPGAETAWTAALYADKTRIAAAATTPRILAVSGSGLLFSLDTLTLSQRTGRPAINFGTHAGLGLPYILDRTRRVMRPKDTILLAPEYELLQADSTPTELAIQLSDFYDRDFVAQQPPAEKLRYLFGYSVLSSLVEGAKWLLHGPPAGRPDVALDKLGNERGNTVAKSKNDRLALETPNLPPRPVSSDIQKMLRSFAQEAARRNVRVYALAPALVSTPGYQAASYRKFQESLGPLFSGMGITYLGNAETGFLAPEDMYDSVYHANDRGRAAYTARVAALLCTQLQCRP